MAQKLKFGNGTWATKEGSTLAYNDENENYKPLPFNFERDSIATRVNKEGLIEVVGNDIPRIDYTDSTEGALLLEPSRSNLYTYSNDVSFWTKSNVVTTSDYAISPDGTQNAFRAAFSSSTGLLYVTATGTTGTNNTLSVWAKSNNGSSNKFRFFVNGNTTLSNDFIATDEWQRFEFTFNCTSVTAGLTGASDSATNDIIFYGFQHEVGSYPTSYIPTNGSTVQRAAETCNGSGNSEVFNDSEGVLFADIAALADDLSNRTIGILANSNNLIELAYRNSTNQIRCLIKSSGVVDVNIQYTLSDITLYSKIAIKYKNNDCSLWVNGSEVGADTTANMPSGLSELNFNRFDGAEDFYGKTKEIAYYDTTLTDEELEYMTSYRSLNEMVTELNLNAL